MSELEYEILKGEVKTYTAILIDRPSNKRKHTIGGFVTETLDKAMTLAMNLAKKGDVLYIQIAKDGKVEFIKEKVK